MCAADFGQKRTLGLAVLSSSERLLLGKEDAWARGPRLGGRAISTEPVFELSEQCTPRPAIPADITEPRRGEGNPAPATT